MRSISSLATAEALERRALLSSDLNIDFPLGVTNATPSGGLGISLDATAVQADGKILLVGRLDDAHQELARVNADGTLDFSFGSKGVVDFSLGNNSGQVECVAKEPDGDILVGGSTSFPAEDAKRAPAIVAFLPDGSIDRASVDLVSNAPVKADDLQQVDDISAQPDGSLVICYSSIGSPELLRYHSDGSLDVKFNPNRTQLLGLAGAFSDPARLTHLPDGGWIVYNPQGIAHVRANGRLDKSFGDGGYANPEQDLTDYESSPRGVAVDDQGNLLLEAFDLGNTPAIVIDRVLPNGTLDTTFGDGGRRVLGFDARASGAGVELASKGRILAFATIAQNSTTQVAVARLKSTGAIDKSFGDNGILTVPPVPFIGATFLDRMPDGRVLLSASFGPALLLRFDVAGNPLSDFATGPVAITRPLGESGQVNALLRLSDDSMLVAGYSSSPLGIDDFYLAKFLADGSFDTSFANGAGYTTLDFGATDDQATKILLLPDGRILVGGTASDSFALARFTSDGAVDLTFGDDGRVTISGAGTPTFSGMTIQNDGKIVFTGSVDGGAILARLNTDGSLDSSFATKGIYRGTGALANFFPADVAIQSTGRIVVGGSSGSSGINGSRFFAAGFTAAGVLDPHFGAKGVFSYRPDSEGNGISAMLVLPNNAILAAGFGSSGAALLELSAQGVLNTHFGDPSSLMRFHGANLGEIKHLSIDSRGRFILSNETQVARLNSDFTLDKTFATGGVRATQPTDFNRFYLNDAVVLSTGRTVVATGFGLGAGPLVSFGGAPIHLPGIELNAQGTLIITGTSGNDFLTLQHVGANLRVSYNGMVRNFPFAKVRRISADLGAGNDSFHLADGAGHASVDGGAGDDTIITGSGDDRILGGDGNDLINPGLGGDSISGGDGNDTLDYHDRTENLSISSEYVTVNGQEPETQVAEDFENVTTGSGDDTIGGIQSPGLFDGGAGNDYITENGTLIGGSGDDSLNDIPYLASAPSLFYGGGGDDSISGDGTLFGEGGNDTLEGSGYLDGGSGDDNISFNGHHTTVLGQAGDDYLVVEDGNHIDIHGGSGIDTIDFSQFFTKVGATITLNDIADDGTAGHRLNVHSDVENVIGTSLADSIVGDSADNNLDGGFNNITGVGDTILGGAGNDTLSSYGGGSKLFGQDGNDTLNTDDGFRDTVDGGPGIDTADVDHRDHVVRVENVTVGS